MKMKINIWLNLKFHTFSPDLFKLTSNGVGKLMF